MSSRNLDLFCSHCDSHIVLYRKEGSGNLVRLYFDRILQPESLAKLKSTGKKSGKTSDLPPLVCPQCGILVGVPMVRGADHRPAYRLIKGSFKRKKKL